MIDLTIHEEQLKRTIQRAKERDIIIPTFKQLKNPALVPDKIKQKLKNTGLWDVDPVNLFRITWKNEPTQQGGLYGGVNYVEFPRELTGTKARIFALVGKWIPTGCHKVGATFGCLVPRLITGQFDPTFHKAVWPSTGNYCRGGAYNAHLLSCESIAILPEGMSRERFEWLETMAGEVIATAGSESNVKEIFDKTWELRNTRDNIMVFNQFEEMGNYLWHYEVTGNAIKEAADQLMKPGDHFAGVIFTTGSAGTIASGDYLKEIFPQSKIGAAEALQCPTLLENGFGAHRLEGIGDKHVPWIHNVKNTDLIVAVDDDDAMNVLRLFNEPAGHKFLRDQGVPEDMVGNLSYLGISGIANVMAAIKMAKYYELDEKDIIATVLTDSVEMYQSRLTELRDEFGEYQEKNAAIDFHRHLMALKTDNMLELTYEARRRVHNLKYYTWIEQQGRELEELNAQWYDYDHYWGSIRSKTEEIDQLIDEFNEKTGLLKSL